MRRLTTSKATADSAPAWSPDGRRIAFVRRNWVKPAPILGVYIVGADGSGLHRVVRPTRFALEDVTWAPDGKRLAVSDGIGRIRLIRDDGTGIRTLAAPGLYEIPDELAWSPDGRWLAYAAKRRIWIRRADGSRRRRIAGSDRRDASSPSWSPDGRRLALALQSWVPEFKGEAASDVRLESVLPDSRGRRIVAADADPSARSLWGAPPASVAWSPGGRTLLWAFPIPEPESPVGATALFVVAPSGRRRLVLSPATPTVAGTTDLDWQPLP